MERLARFIVKNRNKIGITFICAVVVSVLLIPMVRINYDLSEYVPNSERAKKGLNIVEDEFGMQSFARVMINDVTLVQAKEYKTQIEKVDGVDMVLWLDDSVDVYRPIEFISDDILMDSTKMEVHCLKLCLRKMNIHQKLTKQLKKLKVLFRKTAI